MTVIALAGCLLFVAFGVLGLVSPFRVVRIVRYFQTPAGLFLAAAIRVVMGVALFLAAPDSRAPEALRILGVVIVVAGVATLFVGPERFGKLVDWWSGEGPALVRAQAVFALAVGLVLAYALVG